MGLDISAHSRCRFVHGGGYTDACEEQDHVYVYTMDCFAERLDGRDPGCYVTDDASFGFQAGSYTGYNRWREQLSHAALGVAPQTVWNAPEKFAGRPFLELIHFADNEGAIGPATSLKLLADFEAWADLLKLVADPTGWFEPKYRAWRDAFRIGADDGFVVFG